MDDLVYVRVNLRLQQQKRDPKYKEKVVEWMDITAVESDVDADELHDADADAVDDNADQDVDEVAEA